MHWVPLLTLGLVSLASSQIVDTEYGPIEGSTVTLEDGTLIESFYGVPFAKPPVDELRFRAPEEPDPWEEVLPTTRLPDACIQSVVGTVWLTHPLWTRYSEDCLYLNIQTPQDRPDDPIPVMVWFHGGGYTGGASFQYPGHFLAARGVVVVTVNYRLGALGYMSAGDGAASGNYGLLDQVRALEFVRDNIAAFGGDPNMVTIFGQSAGASSSGLIGMLPRAQGLFHQMITESGSDQAFWAINGPEQDPDSYTRMVAEQLDCPTEDSFEMMDCLRDLPAADIRDTSFNCTPGTFCQGFAPVVDGDILPDHPQVLRETGQYAQVPVITGQCTEDGSLYTLFLVPRSAEGGFNQTDFYKHMWEDLIAIYAPAFPEYAVQGFEASVFYYTRWPYYYDEEENRQSFNDMITDYAFGYTADIQMKTSSLSNPVYHYLFGIMSTANEVIPEWMGVPHTGEVPYVWGLPQLETNPEVREDSEINFDFIPWNDLDRVWAEYVMDLWANFAKFGNPTPEPVDTPNGSGPVTWEPFDNETLPYIYMDHDVVEIRNEYKQHEFAFWTEYIPYILGLKPPTIPVSERTRERELTSATISNAISKFIADIVEKRMNSMGN